LSLNEGVGGAFASHVNFGSATMNEHTSTADGADLLAIAKGVVELSKVSENQSEFTTDEGGLIGTGGAQIEAATKFGEGVGQGARAVQYAAQFEAWAHGASVGGGLRASLSDEVHLGICAISEQAEGKRGSNREEAMGSPHWITGLESYEEELSIIVRWSGEWGKRPLVMQTGDAIARPRRMVGRMRPRS
jgi:hypothetical protein